MANYHVKVAVNNSKGNQLVKVFNFTANKLEHCEIYGILHNLVKKNYTLTIESKWKKPAKNIPLSFEQLCKAVSKCRFYETETTRSYEYTYSWKNIFTFSFPCIPYINQFHADWGGTFFEIDFAKQSLVKANFDSIKEIFENHDLDLCKSKREGLWYTHYYLEIRKVPNTLTSLAVYRRVTSLEYKTKTNKVEL